VKAYQATRNNPEGIAMSTQTTQQNFASYVFNADYVYSGNKILAVYATEEDMKTNEYAICVKPVVNGKVDMDADEVEIQLADVVAVWGGKRAPLNFDETSKLWIVRSK
jgi:hypothetical protein